jgi:hypothetical protein
MTRHTAKWVAGGALALVGTLAVSACGVSGAGAAKPAAAINAHTIFATASSVQYKDIEFKMDLSGTSGGNSGAATGTGTITTSPNRADVQLSATEEGQQVNIELIEDGDANVTYVKVGGLSSLGVPAGKFIKVTSNSASSALTSLFSAFTPDQITNYKNLKGVTLVGAETVDGIAVWHLKGTKDLGSTSATADFYVRQDNNYPYKFVAHASGGASADVTVTFTGVDTGASVTLPTPDQVTVLPS